MRRILGALPIVGLLSVFAFVGCGGSDGPPLVDVTGKVTVDGKPVSTGGYSLNFIPNGNGRPQTIEVGSNGEFSGKAPSGKCEVSLSGSGGGGHDAEKAKGTGKKKSSMYQNSYAPLKQVDVSSGAALELKFQKEGGKGTSGGH